MRNISQRKGQVGTLGPAMIALVLASALLIFGLIISQELRDTDVISAAFNASADNETLTTVTETGETLVAGPGGVCTVVEVRKQDNYLVIASDNYTVSACIVSFATGGNVSFNNTNWNLNYTYTYGGEAWLSTNETITGLGTFGDFWEIIVLAIVITVVIGLLLAVFGGRRQR